MRPLRAVLALQCLHLAAAEWKFHEYAKHDTACAPRYINVGMPRHYTPLLPMKIALLVEALRSCLKQASGCYLLPRNCTARNTNTSLPL